MATVQISRQQLLRQGVLLEAAVIAWNVIEGIVAVTAGTLSNSVALIAFGIDSFVEVASAAVVLRRLRKEERGQSAEETERLERRAGRIA